MRISTFVRRTALLVATLSVVLGLGGLAFWASARSGQTALRVHRGDRSQMQRLLAGLTNQYLQFSALELANEATRTPWSLRPDAGGDRAELARFVRTSPLFDQGAALVGLDGRPLTTWSKPPGLPASEDKGFLPLQAALLAGRPGVSDVIDVHGTPEVALAVPVGPARAPRALLVGVADARSWPLEGYTARLDFGPTAQPYILDAHGTIAAAGDPSLVGRHLAGSPATAALAAGRSGFVAYRAGGVALAASYAPTGFDGWSGLTVQNASVFSGQLRRAGTLIGTVVALLLAAAAGALVFFNHRRNLALRRAADSALYDPTTGLPQRQLFYDRLNAALARHRRTSTGVAVFFCDLDGFKAVNDRFGHNRGDAVLAETAVRLRGCLREEDTAARLGGDEFVALVEGMPSVAEATAMARRVHDATVVPMEIAGQHVRVGVSVGVAVLEPGHTASAADLLNTADLGMYDAKVSGAGWHVSTVTAAPGSLPQQRKLQGVDGSAR